MDSLNQAAHTPNKNRLAQTFAKVLHIHKTKLNEKLKQDKPATAIVDQDEKLESRAAMDAFIAKVFAAISSVKAAYAQLQNAQSPYDPEGIQTADQVMVSELKMLSEFKQSFLKKHFDDNNAPETTQLLAEIQEQKNLVQIYDITLKKLDSQRKLKESEIIFLKEKLEEANRENKLIDKRLNSNGSFSFSFSPHSFLSILHQTTKSIKSFVRFMMNEMEAANWDLNAGASAIQPDVVYPDTEHKCFAFESFVCQVMFDGFNDAQSKRHRYFMDKFMELKSLKAREYITRKPNSKFAKFCWSKYLKLVHPKMELSLFGNLNQRNLVAAGNPPETNFFTLFADVAKRVWLLHCLAFAFDDPNKAVSIFQVRKGTRFTEVFMESVNEEPPDTLPEVGFTVVPGFKVGKTVIQCQVYLT